MKVKLTMRSDIKPDIDIVIVNYCSTMHTINCLNSIFSVSNGFRTNVIVIDNSSDDNPDRISDLYSNVNLIKNKENIGFGKAINIALTKCSAPIFILLNPDTIVSEGFFDEIIGYIKKNPDVGIVGPRIYEKDGAIQGSARRFPTPMTSIFGRRSPITKLFPNNRFSKKEFICFGANPEIPIEVDWVSGACMVIRREAFVHTGGFDENFFLYWEDTDLCKRMKENGWRVMFFPMAKICHSTGKSSETTPLFAIYHFHRSCFYLFRKHAKWPMRLITPITFIGLIVRCLLIMLMIFITSVVEKKKHPIIGNLSSNRQKVKKTKILRIVSRLNIGGPSIHAALLTKQMNNSRYESLLIAGNPTASEGSMGYLIDENKHKLLKISQLQRELLPLKDLIAFFKILSIIIKFKPDIVHTHMAKAGAIARSAVFLRNLAMNKKVKTVHTYHGHVLEGYFGYIKTKIFILIERIVALYTNSIIAISKTQKWELSKKYKIAPSKKIHTINLGFDLIPFVSAHMQRGRFRKRMQIDDDTLLIGIVGRLVPIKNHYMFLDAAKLFIDMDKNEPISFVIIGDGELRTELEAYAMEIGINEFVYFHGWERNIPSVYADLDMLALTSKNEGTPVSIIEAMAAKVPVITTGVGGIKDLLGEIDTSCVGNEGFLNCERGILCPKNNPDAFASGMNYLRKRIRLDINTSKSKRAQEYVLMNYSDTRLIQKIEKLYGEIISEG